jgi:serine/threonine-protein kinase
MRLGPDVETWAAPATPLERSSLVLRPGERVAGVYEVREALGRGSAGRVYLAHDERIDRPIALKVLESTRSDEELLREGATLAQLAHPHVVEVYALVRHRGRPVLAMELVPGGSLAEVAPGSPEDVVYWLDGVLSGLDALHAAGLVHRDLKPANVLRGAFGETKLSDFGLVTRVDDTAPTLEGTPAYCAPEVVRGSSVPVHLRVAADYYALGVMAFELFTGRRPFEHDDPFEVLRSHVHDPAPKVSDILPALAPFDAWVGSLLEKEPSRRVIDAGRLRVDLLDALRQVRSSEHAAPRVLIAEAEGARGDRLERVILEICPGLRVTRSGDGVEAARLVERGAVDLAIVGLELPGHGALELCALARALPSPVPTLVTMQHGTARDWALAQALGARACLLEPYSRDTVEVALRHVLQWCAMRDASRVES